MHCWSHKWNIWKSSSIDIDTKQMKIFSARLRFNFIAVQRFLFWAQRYSCATIFKIAVFLMKYCANKVKKNLYAQTFYWSFQTIT